MSTAVKWTASRIKAAKGKQKLACLTAYDYSTAHVMDETGVPLILVGDSLAMTMLGYENTLPVTMEEMLHHTAAVTRGVRQALVVADMPFMSYQVSIEQALENAGRFIKQGGAGAVKIEGGANRAETVKALLANGIPVLGHIGLTPQSLRKMGGYKIQGREKKQAAQLVKEAQTLQKAGIFALVLECIPEPLAKQITRALDIPTIGIGAGRFCDGQILVAHDLLGLHTSVSPKFVRRYAELGKLMKSAFENYRNDVEHGSFPGPEHTY